MRLVSQQDTFDDFRDFKKLSARVIHPQQSTKHPCKEMVSINKDDPLLKLFYFYEQLTNTVTSTKWINP
jgi:hypothetical protein